MENNLAMISAIARASRAYSVGVRNSHLEVFFNFIFFKLGNGVSAIHRSGFSTAFGLLSLVYLT